MTVSSFLRATVLLTIMTLLSSCGISPIDPDNGGPVDDFVVKIERTDNSYQGTHETIDVTVDKVSELMGGFDIMVAYDASALLFVTAFEGDLYGEPCNWEYFTYRYGPFGNCGNACPSGMVRVVGIAETPNGASHPDCFGPDGLAGPFTLCTFDFLITDHPVYQCLFIPIRFFWLHCDNNAIWSKMVDTQFVSENVFDFDLSEITDPDYGYPTYYGAQDEDCFSGDLERAPVRKTKLINGGISIACPDPGDVRGDVNLNQRPWEIADIVLFHNCLDYGLSVFSVDPELQLAATDINGDGIPLSPADYALFTLIVVGTLDPEDVFDSTSPNVAIFTAGPVGDWTEVAVNSVDTLATLQLVIDGSIVPQSLIPQTSPRWFTDADSTVVTMFPYGGITAGNVLRFSGQAADLRRVSAAMRSGVKAECVIQ